MWQSVSIENRLKVLSDRSLKKIGCSLHLASLRPNHITRTGARLQIFFQSCSFSIQIPPERSSRLTTILSHASAIGLSYEGASIFNDDAWKCWTANGSPRGCFLAGYRRCAQRQSWPSCSELKRSRLPFGDQRGFGWAFGETGIRTHSDSGGARSGENRPTYIAK